jgi:hypothetical protein
MFDAHAVNFTRRALNQTEVVFAVQMQGDAVVINAVRRFFSPARIGWLSVSVIFMASVILSLSFLANGPPYYFSDVSRCRRSSAAHSPTDSVRRE